MPQNSDILPPRVSQTPEVLAERCEYLYRRVVPGVVATLAMSLVFCLFLIGKRPHELVLFWYFLIVLIAGAFWALSMAYRRRSAQSRPADWIRRLAIGAVALGAGWGFAAAVFFPGREHLNVEQEQVFIAFVVALVAAGGLPMFSTVWWIYALYAGAVMLPFNAVLFSEGGEFFKLLGAAVPLFYAANVITAYQLGRAFSTAYGLRGAYRKLSGDNAEINEQLNYQLGDLLEAHQAVQAYGRKLALFTERAPIAVFEFDAQAAVLDMNPAAENLFGYAQHELVGRNGITMLFPPEERVQTEKWWRGFVAAGMPGSIISERCLRRDGLELTCDWTLTPLVDEENRVTSVILQGRDITQQREADRMRNEFTSTLSHELRTPLTSILGSLSLLRSGVLGELGKEPDEACEIAERNGQRLLDLINEVLDIEKLESGRIALLPEPVDLHAVVKESLRLNQGFADRFLVPLRFEGKMPEVLVRADRKRLMQIMTNLLSNAAKFSPPNVAVEVRMRGDGEQVRVEVSDRGPGIPEKFRGKIFGRFAQADSVDSRIKGGTGLGLAICKRLIEMMHGKVGFDDRAGGGTTFWFRLPVLKTDAADEGGVRVLLTERDLIATEYLTMVLEKEGYRVDSAPDASTSRALLGRWRYGVWLLSRSLHDVAGSVDLVAEMRHRLEGTRIIMLMNLRSEQTMVSNQKERGIVGWLMKNDSRANIAEAMKAALGGDPPASG